MIFAIDLRGTLTTPPNMYTTALCIAIDEILNYDKKSTFSPKPIFREDSSPLVSGPGRSLAPSSIHPFTIWTQWTCTPKHYGLRITFNEIINYDLNNFWGRGEHPPPLPPPPPPSQFERNEHVHHGILDYASQSMKFTGIENTAVLWKCGTL